MLKLSNLIMEISMTVTPYIANTDIHGHVNSSTGFPVIETLNAEFQSRKWVNPVPQVTFRDWETISKNVRFLELENFLNFKICKMAILRKLCFVADFFGQLALRLKL